MNSNDANWIKINKSKLPPQTRVGNVLALGSAQYRVESAGGWWWFSYWLLGRINAAPVPQTTGVPPVIGPQPPVILQPADSGGWSSALPGMLFAGIVAAELSPPAFAQPDAPPPADAHDSPNLPPVLETPDAGDAPPILESPEPSSASDSGPDSGGSSDSSSGFDSGSSSFDSGSSGGSFDSGSSSDSSSGGCDSGGGS
jgi:hypothetical protein